MSNDRYPLTEGGKLDWFQATWLGFMGALFIVTLPVWLIITLLGLPFYGLGKLIEHSPIGEWFV